MFDIASHLVENMNSDLMSCIMTDGISDAFDPMKHTRVSQINTRDLQKFGWYSISSRCLACKWSFWSFSAR